MFETKYSGYKTKRMLGEQKTVKYAPDSASPEYQQVGSSTSYKGSMSLPDTRLQSVERTHAPFAKGGSGSQVSCYYPDKAHAKFGAEKSKNTLKSPTSDNPKAM